jgi:hypothetical protein
MKTKMIMCVVLTILIGGWQNSANAEIIFAGVSNGTLIVACDGEDDHFIIIVDGTTDGRDYYVHWWPDSTTAPLVSSFSGVTDVIMFLGEGNNYVRLFDEEILGSLEIISGDGDDDISLEDSIIGTSTNLDLGHGDNRVFTPGNVFNGSLTINTGDGTDQINPGTSNQRTAVFNGSVRISLGDGQGYCVFDDSQCNGDISLTFGVSTYTNNYSRLTGDYIGNVIVNSVEGDDKHLVRGNIGGDLELRSTGGNDELLVEGCTVQGDLVLKTAGGKDFIRLRQQYGPVEVFGKTTIESGAHADDIVIDDSILRGAVSVKTAGSNDLVEIDDSTFVHSLYMNLGGGSDDLRIENASSLSSTFLNGGSGMDFGSANNSSLGQGRRLTRLSIEQGNLAN